MRKTLIALAMLLLVVGSFLAGAWYSRRVTSANFAAAPRYDLVPMSPNPVVHQHGEAPDHAMRREPADAAAADPAYARPILSASAATVKVSRVQQQLIGITLGQVEEQARTHTVRALGRVAVDETRVYRLTAAVDGWIKQIFPNSTGSLVEKDEPLVSFYSPDFLAFQQAYLYALAGLERSSGASLGQEQLALARANVLSAKDRLTALGLGAAQIDEIARNRQFAQDVLVAAPNQSFVLARNVSPGQRFERGTELYRLADLSSVWILADLFEGETAYVRPGVRAHVSLPQQGKVLDAQVTPVLPQFDTATRTMNVRLEAANPDYVLRPDMFVDVELLITFPPTIAVPVDAVIDSGLKKTVFVERGDGVFEARLVETGWHFGDSVQIVKGLTPGERFVASGTFLLDSESRMKSLSAATSYDGAPRHDHMSGAHNHEAHSPVGPAPAAHAEHNAP